MDTEINEHETGGAEAVQYTVPPEADGIPGLGQPEDTATPAEAQNPDAAASSSQALPEQSSDPAEEANHDDDDGSRAVDKSANANGAVNSTQMNEHASVSVPNRVLSVATFLTCRLLMTAKKSLLTMTLSAKLISRFQILRRRPRKPTKAKIKSRHQRMRKSWIVPLPKTRKSLLKNPKFLHL